MVSDSGDAQNQCEAALDLLHRFGFQSSQSLQQPRASDGAYATTNRDAFGVHAFGRRDARPQWAIGKRTRHRYHHDEFIVDSDEYVVDGDDDGGPVLAWFTGASCAEGDQPQLTASEFRQDRR
ncbi:hypothetical protein A5696_10610 [Mycobacterium sp. E2699]|nr:hypothetical protein A5696_10610 [Mycobacterium sp. E2699]